MIHQLYRYALPNVHWEGWAVLLIDSGGMLAVCSDFGNYAYHWPQNGWGEGDFREFLLGCDSAYLMGKLGHGTVFDGEATRKRIKEEILDLRRTEQISKAYARKEWDLLLRCEVTSSEEFYAWWTETAIDDSSQLARHKQRPELVGFFEKVWPRFRQALQDDLRFLRRAQENER